MRFPSQAQKKHGNSVFKQKILALFSRGCHHKPNKTTEIPFSNISRRYWHYFPEVPITSPKKGNPVFKQKILLALFSRKAQKDTEIPFSNEVPITSQKKTRKSCFQIEDIGIIFQKSPKRHGNPVRFQLRFPSQAQKKHGNSVFKQQILILFSRGCHLTSQKKKRKSRFQIEAIGIIFQRFPSQAQKKGNPVFKQKILALFSRKAQKDTEIPFSNEVPITSPEKTRKFRFQIEDIGIIFQRFPTQAK